jgi:hypothetical protein
MFTVDVWLSTALGEAGMKNPISCFWEMGP